MRRARTWGWARMRRYDDPYNDLEPSSPHQSCPDCIIAMRGYDFREGHLLCPHSLGIDAQRLQIFGDMANVLILGAARLDLAADHQERR